MMAPRSSERALGLGRICAAATFIVATAAAVAAHDFWLEPSNFHPASGDLVRVHLRVGDHFAGEPVGRNDARIEKFFVSGPSGERPVVGQNGGDPAGAVRVDRPGTWIIAYRSRASRIELAAPAFEEYLNEEGLERIIDERAKRGESRAAGREVFSRSVKALVRVGDETDGFDRVLGLALEIVPERAPWDLADGRLPVRLLASGRPLEGALIVSMTKGAGGSRGEVLSGVRTDAEGKATVIVRPGVALIKAVHMMRSSGNQDAEWESTWTSLTFEIPGRSLSSGAPENRSAEPDLRVLSASTATVRCVHALPPRNPRSAASCRFIGTGHAPQREGRDPRQPDRAASLR